ncbi:MAG: chromosomal replication initiator protein DnaA [Oscillospiraceae bacterium]|nr:chromosomal replication initiator protein DnaA [Oscillospiraceae bacterium]
MNSIDDIWREVLNTLSQKLTPTAIRAWFDDCVPIEIVDSRLVIRTTSDFKRNIISDRFSDIIKAALSDLFASEFDLLILTDDDEYVSSKDRDDSFPEMEGYTFDRFIVGKSNELAHAAAVAVAEKPGKAFDPLFIYGNSGLGKTHLLLAIGQYIHAHDPKARIAYVKGDEFTIQMVKAIKEGSTEEFHTRYRDVDLLLVDDIQFIAGKQRTQEEFFHAFNNIYEAGHQIVITSDRPPIEMSLLDDRLRTRFEGGLMVDIQPPDLETRMAIARNKAAQLGLLLPGDVVSYIAEHVTANIRQLEGVIKRLTAYKELLGEEISIENAKRAIEDVTRDGDYIPTPEKILRETAKYFGIREEEITGQSRSKNTVMARQISMHLMRTLTDLSLQDIGEKHGKRNHSTVLSSIRKVEDLLRTDSNISGIVRDISSNITTSTSS